MEQTTLQERIEERAKQKLLNDLLIATDAEKEIVAMFGDKFTPQLNARRYSPGYGGNSYIECRNEFTQKLFDQLIPKYITMVTDEILRAVDEVKNIVNERETENQDY